MEGLLLSRETQNSIINNNCENDVYGNDFYGNKIVDQNWKNTSKRANKNYQIDFSDLGIINDTVMNIIQNAKSRNDYILEVNYLSSGALRLFLNIYRNVTRKLGYKKAIEFLKRFIESEVGVSFDEFYENVGELFDITGFNDIFHFDDDY